MMQPAGTCSGRRPLSELLFANDSCSFANNDKLIGGDVWNRLTIAVRPADGQRNGGFRAQAKVQAPIIGGIKARLRQYFLRLTPVSIVCNYSRPYCAAVALHS